MHAVVITPPAALITLAQAKTHLRVDGSDEDEYITGLIAAAQSTIDGPGGWLGRSVGRQTLEARGDVFYPIAGEYRACGNRAGAIALPYPPVVSVESVTYTDAQGADQTVSADGYTIDHGEVLRPVFGSTWPATSSEANVRVRYVAGYAEVPPSILHAVKIIVGLLYESRTTAIDVVQHTTVASLLGPYRYWGV